jgi:muramidase (phage lysozyme)
MFGDLPDAYPNRTAFLQMVTWSEIGPEIVAASDRGYNVLVGSVPDHILFFSSYADHPRIYNPQFDSTAAGAYQIIEHNYDYYSKLLNLTDFSPTSQDAIALQLIRERGALPDIDGGNIASAIGRCGGAWASLPSSTAGQHRQKLADLITAYSSAGGSITV